MLYSVIIPYAIHMISYWIPSLFFYLVDYCVLDKENSNLKNYKSAIKKSLGNQIFISLPTLYLLKDYIYEATERSINDNISETVIKILLITNFSNLLFYVFHYLLHTRYLFNNIHYIHHEFIEPVGVAALYAHPIEHLFANVLSFLIPVILVGIKYWIMILLLSFSTLVSVLSHVQYDIYLFDQSHLIHHKYFKYNYGFGGYLDKLLGTYKKN